MLREKVKHGFADETWQRAKAEALEVLRSRARRGDPITYSDLVAQIGAIPFGPHDTLLAHFLGELSSEEHAAGRPLITALVVHKHDLQPGKGFFVLARSLGFSIHDETAFWSDQIDQLRSHWKSAGR